MNRSRLLCWGLALLLPMASLAAENPALLSGSGVVKVNGREIPKSSVAYSGDTITTADNATATLTAAGSVISLAPSSSIVYKDNIVEMVTGRVQVTTAKAQIEAHLGKLTITPAVPEVRFQMREDSERRILAALHGSLTVTDGDHVMVLSEGEMMTYNYHTVVPPAGYFPGWIILGAVGGAAGIAAAGIVVAGQKSASPSKP